MIVENGTGNTGKEYFAIAKYKEFDISFLRSGAYVDLNDIAKPHGKRLDNWMRLKSTKELLIAFEEDLAYNGNPGILARKGNRSDTSHPRYHSKTQGTFAHPDIAIAFAQWCNPRFALWVSRQIRHLMTYGEVNLHYTEWSQETRLQGVQYSRDDIDEMHPKNKNAI